MSKNNKHKNINNNNISALTLLNFDKTLKVGFWDQQEPHQKQKMITTTSTTILSPLRASDLYSLTTTKYDMISNNKQGNNNNINNNNKSNSL